MATGFMQRYKGKIKAAVVFLDSGLGKGLQLNAGASFVQGANVWTNAGSPTSGGSGTLATFANPGDLLVDTSGLALYQNTNTLASPTWTAVGVAGSPSLTNLTLSGLLTESVATGLTASTTQTRTGALALTKQINNVATVANASDAVGLPAATPGQAIIIFNNGAHAASVFPAGSSDTIDGGSAGASVTLTNAKRCLFVCVAANTWISAQLGLVSA